MMYYTRDQYYDDMIYPDTEITSVKDIQNDIFEEFSYILNYYYNQGLFFNMDTRRVQNIIYMLESHLANKIEHFLGYRLQLPINISIERYLSYVDRYKHIRIMLKIGYDNDINYNIEFSYSEFEESLRQYDINNNLIDYDNIDPLISGLNSRFFIIDELDYIPNKSKKRINEIIPSELFRMDD